MIRVVLADDHTLVREGIRTLLALVDDIVLVGEAGDGEETLRVVAEARPDVLLLDMRMPKGDGCFVVTELARREILPATLILTTFDDDDAAIEVVRAGARGFLLKDVTLDRLVAAVRELAAGGTMIHPALTARAARELAKPASPAAEATELTTREREVLRLLAAGYSNREIAKALFVAEGTVKNHVSNILTKMGVRDRTRAVLKAAEWGVL
ncbi:response regulator transcription factor [Pendulispora brunnea]|uniref:Response regulator transcription factor n=1 Tax=Pendulispora brunnea TaxID=2905690 RepID=A0ABZ2K0W0_9BACT